MKSGRWSPDRFKGGTSRALCLTSRLYGRADTNQLLQVCSSLFWPGSVFGRPTISFGSGPLSMDMTTDDGGRVSSITLGHTGGPDIPVRIVGVDSAGNEDSNRSYATTVQPGGTTITPGTDAASCINLRMNSRGIWSGFSLFTGGA